MLNAKRILITPGEPAGIGPDISLQMAMRDWPVELIAIADPDLLAERAAQLGLCLQLKEWNPQEYTPHQSACLKVLPIALAKKVTAQKLDKANAFYIQKTLDVAIDLCLKKKAHAIVTGPVHKGLMNEAGIPFTGHTEYFAEQCSKIKNVHYETVMLFVVNALKVALVTTHLPLAQVASAITLEKLQSTLSILHAELKQKFAIPSPRILVCGLNPHAGEGGHLGREELDIIAPLIKNFNHQTGSRISGPYPADTLFTPKYLEQADAVLAMYHDQALPLVKYIGFGHAVNVTLGLPLIRTSVDHGTALTLAASGQADPGSMAAALSLAIKLANSCDSILP